MAPRSRRPLVALASTAALVTAVLAVPAAPAATVERAAAPPGLGKAPVARGTGGAVASVDLAASRVGLQVLKRGGNAVDAAVATAAALGVTEPYSAGVGGGGYLVLHDARTGKVRTIDGRETAPLAMPRDAFVDPGTGEPYPFTPDLVTSGVSVGVPGTVATWDTALRKWGTWSMRKALAPAARLAERGFRVDRTFALQTAENQERFEAYTTTPRLFLPGGAPPEVGNRFRNPDLARTYRTLGERGAKWFYEGRLARRIAALVRKPPVSPTTDLPVPAGFMRPRDLARYRTVVAPATRTRYRGLDVYGMPPSSSGGTTVGEALNIVEALVRRKPSITQVLHRYLEASALAFADRAEHLGDPAFTDVPVGRLLDQRFARERACLVSRDEALTKPVDPGNVRRYDGRCATRTSGDASTAEDTENRETTNLTVVDRWGNVVEYTLTIEQTGGSGLLVPGRGFLLNNELTDFSTEWERGDPNRIQPGKRPRSSMSPTIVARGGKPWIALGSPGGSTIITTVLQVLLNRVELGMRLPQAVAAPRASQRNTENVTAEQRFIDRWGTALGALGHTFTPAGEPGTSAAEIGAATAIELRGRNLVAVAEPTRRGGGSALVVRPR
ncbi:gamma-glutamyltransferase [Nocardioides caldifontis]|uniref:gamma-glutamyltransferase n=1 Tax=Nocardioides caldifontis TaxID=2588938 RepID=UPI0011DF28EB|nr:gamma-glutamyltransferase [Nocardioides caldifontis]